MQWAQAAPGRLAARPGRAVPAASHPGATRLVPIALAGLDQFAQQPRRLAA